MKYICPKCKKLAGHNYYFGVMECRYCGWYQEVGALSFFSARARLADDYEQWRERNNVKDCPLSVITYLDARGLLRDVRNIEVNESNPPPKPPNARLTEISENFDLEVKLK